MTILDYIRTSQPLLVRAFQQETFELERLEAERELRLAQVALDLLRDADFNLSAPVAAAALAGLTPSRLDEVVRVVAATKNAFRLKTVGKRRIRFRLFHGAPNQLEAFFEALLHHAVRLPGPRTAELSIVEALPYDDLAGSGLSDGEQEFVRADMLAAAAGDNILAAPARDLLPTTVTGVSLGEALGGDDWNDADDHVTAMTAHLDALAALAKTGPFDDRLRKRLQRELQRTRRILQAAVATSSLDNSDIVDPIYDDVRRALETAMLSGRVTEELIAKQTGLITEKLGFAERNESDPDGSRIERVRKTRTRSKAHSRRSCPTPSTNRPPKLLSQAPVHSSRADISCPARAVTLDSLWRQRLH